MEEDLIHQQRGGARRKTSKRATRNKALSIVFDESARQEFVTGFRKRKKKRRKVAQAQLQEKERKKRLAQRHEKRALGITEESEEEHQEEASDAENDDLKETVVYEDEHTRTVVNTSSILPEDDPADEPEIKAAPKTSAAPNVAKKQKQKSGNSRRPKQKRQRIR